ncbi:hypothetical protein CKO09_02790 [Chromatium weissei]|nr:hypothetical protein [Chromatium weissei]
MTPTTSEWLGIFAALGSAATWAIGALILKPFAERFPATNLAFTKGVLALIVLGITVLILESPLPTLNSFWTLLLSGVLGIGVADTFFFKALSKLSAHSIVQLMLLGQVVTIVMAVAFLGEILIWQEWFGIFLTTVGTTIILTEPNHSNNTQTASYTGLIFGLISILAMASSITIAKDALAKTDALTATFFRMAGGIASLFLLTPISHSSWKNWLSPLLVSWQTTIKFCAVTIVVTFGGFFLSLLALKHTSLAITNTLLSTEPLFVLLITNVFFSERPDVRRLFGSFISVVGVAFISTKIY